MMKKSEKTFKSEKKFQKEMQKIQSTEHSKQIYQKESQFKLSWAHWCNLNAYTSVY